jgi:hypothetical protein
MPPEVRERVNKSLAIWPPPQSKRDRVMVLVTQRMAGLQGSGIAWRYGAIPEPEASHAAVDAEAEGFAAASAYAASKSLATDEERSDVFRTYIKEMLLSAYRYAKSRPQAAGTSRSGPATQPPPAAFVAVVSGPMQPRGCHGCLRCRLPRSRAWRRPRFHQMGIALLL